MELLGGAKSSLFFLVLLFGGFLIIILKGLLKIDHRCLKPKKSGLLELNSKFCENSPFGEDDVFFPVDEEAFWFLGCLGST